MRYVVPIYISLLFTRIMNFVSPYFVRVNRFMKSISGILFSPNNKQNPTEFLREQRQQQPTPITPPSNAKIIITAGFMEHSPKKQAAITHFAK